MAADVSQDTPAGQEEMKLPPGWTEEDMQACMIAGTPGEMHERLAEDVGTWQGKTTMWMAPGCRADGERVHVDRHADHGRPLHEGRNGRRDARHGPYHGFGIYGFDNVSQKFVATWIDNHSTGIMKGTGELSADGKTITWKYTHNCPITKKPTTMREVETITGPEHEDARDVRHRSQEREGIQDDDHRADEEVSC